MNQGIIDRHTLIRDYKPVFALSALISNIGATVESLQQWTKETFTASIERSTFDTKFDVIRAATSSLTEILSRPNPELCCFLAVQLHKLSLKHRFWSCPRIHVVLPLQFCRWNWGPKSVVPQCLSIFHLAILLSVS